MDEVTVRPAEPDDAFVVAALLLQFARLQGMPPEPGYLDRFVDAWLGDREERPTWIAQSRAEHAGLLTTRLVRELPLPGRTDDRLLELEALFAAPSHDPAQVKVALIQTLVEWAFGAGVTRLRAIVADDDEQTLYRGGGFETVGSLLQRGPHDPS